MTIRAYAAHASGQPLERFDYEPESLGPEQVEIAVEYCGLCHSDLSMLNNDWGMTQYPAVPGHEVIGRIAAVGGEVRHVKVGQRVGLGWFAHSCMTCGECMDGHHNLCSHSEQTIVGRFGGFADRVRCSAMWAIPLPEALDARTAGPLFCGGITVFSPLLDFGVSPVHRVGVVGIGGLGHLAIQFARAWGCEVTAFSSTADKEAEAREMGAHHFVESRDTEAIAKLAGKLDFILVTINIPLDWEPYFAALRARGKLHFVGAVPEIKTSAFTLLSGSKSVSGSPLGSPAAVAKMLEFCARHEIQPLTQHFPLSRVNEAIEHLRSGKARYRVVLENDL